MYKLTRKNGKFPRWMQVTFPTYEAARKVLRRYMRSYLASFGTASTVPRGTHVSLSAASRMGIFIKKV